MERNSRKRYFWILGIALLCLGGIFLALQNGHLAGILSLLQSSDHVWTKPVAFGSFHLAWLAVCVLLSVCAGICGKKIGTGKTDCVLFGTGIFLLALEFYKQAYSYFVLHDGQYDFGIFPFQFCSLPLYLYLLVPGVPEGRIKKTLCKFLALFGTMGGCLVMGYPAFTDRLSLCIHTMLWHTVMIAVGVFLLFARGYGRAWKREVLPASVVLLISIAVATALNFLLTPMALDSPNPLNLFYMSPYEQTYFLVIRDVQRVWGWVPALLTYILLFIFVGATLVFFVTWGINCATKRWFIGQKTCKKAEKI